MVNRPNSMLKTLYLRNNGNMKVSFIMFIDLNSTYCLHNIDLSFLLRISSHNLHLYLFKVV